jgi:hypothetical protein
MLVSCRFVLWKTDEILRTLLLMHDGVRFDQLYHQYLNILRARTSKTYESKFEINEVID